MTTTTEPATPTAAVLRQQLEEVTRERDRLRSDINGLALRRVSGDAAAEEAASRLKAQIDRLDDTAALLGLAIDQADAVEAAARAAEHERVTQALEAEADAAEARIDAEREQLADLVGQVRTHAKSIAQQTIAHLSLIHQIRHRRQLDRTDLGRMLAPHRMFGWAASRLISAAEIAAVLAEARHERRAESKRGGRETDVEAVSQ